MGAETLAISVVKQSNPSKISMNPISFKRGAYPAHSAGKDDHNPLHSNISRWKLTKVKTSDFFFDLPRNS
jgi:hypothetical protein